MEYLALYRKYRPKILEDVVGQDEIVKTLKNAVLCNKISHAYIFSGPRGTGKTTIAKIFAKMVNCANLTSNGSPCFECENCLISDNSNDIIELDAASNNGIDEIREIIDKVKYIPNKLNYKVYIIDEVHMMTTQAFNALLKTLEEPPKYTIFILATTEYHKIPVTITSRCQKFSFRKISVEDIINKLKYINNEEKREVEEDVINEIAKESDGGLRDAINLYDQVSSYKTGKITINDYYEINHTISEQMIDNIINSIFDYNINDLIKYCDEVSTYGTNYRKIIDRMIQKLKNCMIDNVKNENLLEKKNNLKCISNLIMYLNDLSLKILTSSFADIIFLSGIIKYIEESKLEIPEIIEEKENIKKGSSDSKVKNVVESNKINEDKISKEDNLKIENEKVLNYYQENKKCIINNAFSYANKVQLNELRKKIKEIDDISLKREKILMLKDLDVLVVGNEYILISSPQKILVDTAIDNQLSIVKKISEILDRNVFVAVLTEEEWQKEKEKYINNIKNKVKYTPLELPPMVINENIKESQNTLSSIIGEELIEYR